MAADRVDVVGYLDALIASHKALSADAYHVQELPKAEAVRAAVAELVEALSEFDGMAEPSMPGTPPKLRRLREAFARVQGGAA